MLERLISFAEPESGAYGAIAVEGEHSAAALTTGESGRSRCSTNACSRAARGRCGSKPRRGSSSSGSPPGRHRSPSRRRRVRSIELQPVGASVSFSTGAGAERGFEAAGVSWALTGEGRARSLRTLWGLGGDGLLAMFALRDGGRRRHGSETVGAVRISADGKVLAYDEPLLSTEYDAAGRQMRATLELWGEDGALADRGGGLRRDRRGRAALGRVAPRGGPHSRGASAVSRRLGAYEIYTS